MTLKQGQLWRHANGKLHRVVCVWKTEVATWSLSNWNDNSAGESWLGPVADFLAQFQPETQ